MAIASPYLSMLKLGAFPLNSLQVFPSPSSPPSPSWTPNNLNLLTWVDATQQAIVSDSTPIASLSDAATSRSYSGSGITYQTNSRNSLPALRQVGTSLGYLASTQVNISPNTPFVIWSVMKTDGVDAQLFYGTGNYQCRFNYGANRKIQMLAYVPIASGNFTSDEMTNWGIFLIHHTAANQYDFYYNGSLRNGSNATETLENMFDRFLGADIANSGFPTLLGESGIALSPSTEDLNQLGQYLGNKWAI